MGDRPNRSKMFGQGPAFCNVIKGSHAEFVAPVLKSSDFSKL